MKEREQITKKLYTMTDDNPDYKETLRQYHLVHYQIDSLNDICDFKTGLLTIPLPKDENGLRKLFRKIFPNK